MIHGADVSEFQDVNWSAYDSDFSVVRVYNGNRPDAKWDQSRVQGLRARCKVRGYYAYVVANRDAATQGQEFVNAFTSVAGSRQPGEFFVADVEEGSGDQTGRAEAFCSVVDKALGVRTWVYSGSAFRTSNLPGEARPFWEAAYQNTEPQDNHILWQHTDHGVHAGVSAPSDCSVYDGTIDELLTLIDGVKPPQENDMALLYILPDNKTVIVADSQSKRHVNNPGEEAYMISHGLVKNQPSIKLSTGSPDDKYLAALPWAGGKPN